jgi:hypothetical protein
MVKSPSGYAMQSPYVAIANKQAEIPAATKAPSVPFHEQISRQIFLFLAIWPVTPSVLPQSRLILKRTRGPANAQN